MIEALLLAGTTPGVILGLLWGLDRLEEPLRTKQPSTDRTARASRSPALGARPA